MASRVGYYRATRHPWPCLLFLLPLLLAYEGGVIWWGGAQSASMRNGADTWVRWTLGQIGLPQPYWPPVLLAGVFLIWSTARRSDKPDDQLGVVTGMGIESVLFALGLWGMSRGLGPLIDHFGIRLDFAASREQAIGQVITFVGAGVYEEVLFRLVLFTGLRRLLKLVFLPSPIASFVAAVASAALFAAAHHLGPYGEPFEGYVFLFRTLAGLYFAMLYQMRGFGIVVGAHACYDVLVGVPLG